MSHRFSFFLILLLCSLLFVAGPPATAEQLPDSETAADLLLAPSSNHSLLLNGTITQYVSVPHHTALNPSGAITLEAWVRLNSNSGCQTVIGKDWTSAYWLGICDGRMRFYSNGIGSYTDGTAVIPANVWTHIAVVHNNSGRSYYINGQLDHQSGGGSLTTNSHPVGIGYDLGPSSCCPFNGRIASLRLWNSARSLNDIRRTMHMTLDEPRTGLVASWIFNNNAGDSVGNHHGTLFGGGFNNTYPAPAQPAYAVVDRYFNQLPDRRFATAGVHIPSLDGALLIGGRRGSLNSGIIDFVDATTGVTTPNIGSLPQHLLQHTAVYVPDNHTAYTFGGSTNSTSWYAGGIDKIFAIDPDTGATREVTAVLPQGTNAPVAVYHPEQQKVYIFGGRDDSGALTTISIFDPLTETITTPPAFELPAPRYYMSGIYAHGGGHSGHIYLFGGFTNPPTTHSDVYRVELDEDGLGGSVIPLPHASLPRPGAMMNAVEDPHTHLVYLLSGHGQDWVLAFDPQTEEMWQTHVGLPLQRYGSASLYNPTARHLLLIGGDEFNDQRNVWRIPLGDGPLLPVGHWDFPTPVGSAVTTIDGEQDGVIVGTNSNGAYFYRSNGSRTHYTPAALGSAGGRVNDTHYNSQQGHIWLATHDAGGKRIDSSSGAITTYSSAVLGTNQIRAVDPLPNYTNVNAAPRFGTAGHGLLWRRYDFLSDSYVWQTAFSGSHVTGLTHRTSAEAWVLVNDTLRRHTFSTLGGSETNYGSRCSMVNMSDIAFDGEGNWWIAATGSGEFGGGGLCYIPAAATPGTGNLQEPIVGTTVYRVDTDAEGRIWAAVGSASPQTGGLVGYEARQGGLFTQEYDWRNAPISGNTFGSDGWNSNLWAVGAADERVWMGDAGGRLFTLAPRWQRLHDSNNMQSRLVEEVWLMRGRAFLATSSSLHVMMPDGRSWHDLTGIKVWDMMMDDQGRIWAATQNGLRRYTADGWDFLGEHEGERPWYATYALAQDHDGRIWIGGQFGLTLFDRERFVMTLTAANSDLPATSVRALLVDNHNHLWVGTDAGLARWQGTGWELFTTADGLPDNRIRHLAQAGSGELAISTENGLSLYDGSTFATQTLPRPALRLPLTVDESGRLWAGSMVRNGSSWQAYYPTNSGLAQEAISSVVSDGSDRLWFGHSPYGGVSIRAAYLPPFTDAVPTISSISPTSAGLGDEVIISGSGFGQNRDDLVVTIGQGNAEIISVSNNEIRARIITENTSGHVAVSRSGRRVSLQNAFCAIPTITGFTPTGGNVGVEITIRGANFDRGATISMGGNSRLPNYTYPGQLWTLIQPEDAIGDLHLINSCGDGHSATAAEEFRRIDLTIDHMVLNQGVTSMGLVANRQTMLQHYISHSPAPRATDQIAVNQINLTVTEQGQPPIELILPFEGTFFSGDGPPIAALLRDTSVSLNTIFTPRVGGSLIPFDNVTVASSLRNRGQTVASSSLNAHIRPDMVVRVLMVPIMRNDYTTADLNALKLETNRGLDDLRQRLFPTGRVDLVWSPLVYTVDDVLWLGGDTLDLGDTLVLYDASHNLEHARRHWNNNYPQKVMVAYGVVDPSVSTGAPGKAFWPDVSQMLNMAGLSALDTLCDIGAGLLNVLTFGLADIDGCDLEIPLYVGWSTGADNSSRLIGHELGHVFGLVKPMAPNGDLTDNFSHSVYDELDNGECGSDGRIYTVDKTFYRSPGVQEPVINVLTGRQYLPQFSEDDAGDPANEFTDRAKAMMSYACGRTNQNVFFEPADMVGIFYEYFASNFRTGPLPRSAASYRTEGSVMARSVSGDRLFVSGLVNPTAGQGEIRRVDRLGTEAPLDTSYETGFWLVQFNSSGSELSRTGLFPLFRATDHGHGDGDHDHDTEHETGFFAATILAEPGVSRIELRHGETIWDSFSAGSGVPGVSLSSPGTGSYNTTIPVSWTAVDPDGDDLTVTILYSADNGTTWVPVAITHEAGGSRDLPVAALAGSSQARIKVVASDGFHSGEAISPAFSVTAQPPLPFIGAPLSDQLYLEGKQVPISGGALDNQDLVVAADNLRWRSSRDGLLGTGESLAPILSVGTHIITLEAENSLGLTASTSVTIVVSGDYDYDGIPDADELAEGLDPLNWYDGFSDEDGDGLPLVVERRRGLDPNNPDTDGDGRSDAQEIADGTDPAAPDAPLPPDTLQAFPASLEITADLALDTAAAQTELILSSRQSAAWSVTSDAPWLKTVHSSGQTLASVTVIIDDRFLSEDGTYHGNLTFNSSLGTAVVPVTIHMTNVAARSGTTNIYLPLIMR